MGKQGLPSTFAQRPIALLRVCWRGTGLPLRLQAWGVNFHVTVHSTVTTHVFSTNMFILQLVARNFLDTQTFDDRCLQGGIPPPFSLLGRKRSGKQAFKKWGITWGWMNLPGVCEKQSSARARSTSTFSTAGLASTGTKSAFTASA